MRPVPFRKSHGHCAMRPLKLKLCGFGHRAQTFQPRQRPISSKTRHGSQSRLRISLSSLSRAEIRWSPSALLLLKYKINFLLKQ